MEINRKTHTMKIVKESQGIALIEITKDFSRTQAEKRFYVVQVDNNQVKSCVPADMPSDGGTWFARLGVAGVAYVANGRRRETAQRWFRKCAAAAREYQENFTNWMQEA